MTTLEITDELIHLNKESADYNRERMKLMVKYLQRYLNTYDQQYHYEDYTDETLINDVLYGLGVAIDPENHQHADGFDRWKQTLKSTILNEDN